MARPVAVNPLAPAGEQKEPDVTPCCTEWVAGAEFVAGVVAGVVAGTTIVTVRAVVATATVEVGTLVVAVVDGLVVALVEVGPGTAVVAVTDALSFGDENGAATTPTPKMAAAIPIGTCAATGKLRKRAHNPGDAAFIGGHYT